MASSTACCLQSGVSSRCRQSPSRVSILFLAMGVLALLGTVPCSSRNLPAASTRRLTLQLRRSRHAVEALRRAHRRQLNLFDPMGSTPATVPFSEPAAAPIFPPASTPGGGGGAAVGSQVMGLVTVRDAKNTFTVDVMMGTPPQLRSLEVGFNEYLSWTFCTGAASAFAVNPSFATMSSSSLTDSTCASASCQHLQSLAEATCEISKCNVARYDDQMQTDGVTGHLVSDFVMFKGDAISRFRFDGMACMTSLTGRYINFSGDGMLGLGQSSGGFFDSITQQHQLPKILSLCFNSSGYMERSSSAFGGTAESVEDGGSVVVGAAPNWISYPNGLVASTTPLVAKEATAESPVASYAAMMEGWTVGSGLSGAPIAPPAQPMVIFASTGFMTFVPPITLTSLTTAIQQASGLVLTTLPLDSGGQIVAFDSPSCSLASMPDITLTFKGGATLTAKPEDYTLIWQETAPCMYMLGFISHPQFTFVGLGMSMLQTKWLTFDMSGGFNSSVLKVGEGTCFGERSL